MSFFGDFACQQDVSLHLLELHPAKHRIRCPVDVELSENPMAKFAVSRVHAVVDRDGPDLGIEFGNQDREAVVRVTFPGVSSSGSWRRPVET